MEYYIKTGNTARDIYYLNKITKYKLPNLSQCNIDKLWIDFCLETIDNLAVDFNFYMFFKNTFPNIPQRIFFTFLNTAVLELSKLLDDRRNNRISIGNTLNRIEQNINDKTVRRKFILFKNDIKKWLDDNKNFIDNLIVLRDKMIAHQDVSITQLDVLNVAMHKFDLDEFIYISNVTIEILCNIIESIESCGIATSGYYDVDEFNFIYEALRSLDKVEKNVFVKNQIIHNIDLELKQIQQLIK